MQSSINEYYIKSVNRALQNFFMCTFFGLSSAMKIDGLAFFYGCGVFYFSFSQFFSLCVILSEVLLAVIYRSIYLETILLCVYSFRIVVSS